MTSRFLPRILTKTRSNSPEWEIIRPASVRIFLKNVLKRYFSKNENFYQVKKEIREMVIFAQQNVIKDPPFSKMDLIICRNLLIYLSQDLQRKLLPIFHYGLNENGVLFLGPSETIGESSDLFSTRHRKWKIYKRKGFKQNPHLRFSPSGDNQANLKEPREFEQNNRQKLNLPELANRHLIEKYAPTSVIINNNYDVLYVHGRTGKFLESTTGEVSWNIINMAREGLKVELITAIRKVIKNKSEVVCKNLRIKTNGGFENIDLLLHPIEEDTNHELILISFQLLPEPETDAENNKDKEALSLTNKQVKDLEHELKSTREYLQTTIEELETSNEELKSTNEELQSANEELQSTNEELETSKEELQSVNEELITVNSEHQNKIEELSNANNDMNNLLASTEIGTIFLDNQLCIKRFTPSMTRIISLIQADIGRSVIHFSSNLLYDKLVQDVESVLSTLVFKETEVQTRDGVWYNMRIMPYRTIENVIDGVVITFADITILKMAEDKLKQTNHSLNNLREAGKEILESELSTQIPGENRPDIIQITDLQGNIVPLNRPFPSGKSVTGSGESVFENVPPEFLDSFQEQIQKCIQTGLVVTFEFWRSEAYRNKNLYRTHIIPIQEAKKITNLLFINFNTGDQKKG